MKGDADLDELRAELDARLASLSDKDIWHVSVGTIRGLLTNIDTLRTHVATLREIADALANEDQYQAETGEGSMAYLARLKERARAVLATVPESAGR